MVYTGFPLGLENLEKWESIFQSGKSRTFVGTRPLIHKHVKMSVGKWIVETTRPHKHVHIPEDQIFLTSLPLAQSFPNYILFEINSS